MGPTGVPGFGTNEVFEGQAWGAFPRTGAGSVPFSPIAWAKVNSDGTFAASSGNLEQFKGSTGIYVLVPTGSLTGLPPANMLAMAITSNEVPAVAATGYGVGPGSAGVEVSFNTWAAGNATPSDNAFVFLLWAI